MVAILFKWGVVSGLVLLLYSFIGDPVVSMPFGLQEPLEFFSSTLHGVIEFMPWFEVPFNLILVGLSIKMVLITIALFKWLMSLIF